VARDVKVGLLLPLPSLLVSGDYTLISPHDHFFHHDSLSFLFRAFPSSRPRGIDSLSVFRSASVFHLLRDWIGLLVLFFLLSKAPFYKYAILFLLRPPALFSDAPLMSLYWRQRVDQRSRFPDGFFVFLRCFVMASVALPVFHPLLSAIFSSFLSGRFEASLPPCVGRV